MRPRVMGLFAVVGVLGACGPEQPAEVAAAPSSVTGATATAPVSEPSATASSSAVGAAVAIASVADAPSASTVTAAATTAEPPSSATVSTGNIPKEVLQKKVRQNFGRVRMCYEMQLRNDPTLKGKVVVDFTINPDGSVANAKAESKDLKDAMLLQCIEKAFNALSFPKPEGGKVNVKYPIELDPGT